MHMHSHFGLQAKATRPGRQLRQSSLSGCRKSLSLPVEINKDNWLRGGEWSSPSRGCKRCVIESKWEPGKRRRQTKRGPRCGRLGWGAHWLSVSMCRLRRILKGYSIWFVIFSLSLLGGREEEEEECRGYRRPQTLIDGRIMPSDCESGPPLPARPMTNNKHASLPITMRDARPRRPIRKWS